MGKKLLQKHYIFVQAGYKAYNCLFSSFRGHRGKLVPYLYAREIKPVMHTSFMVIFFTIL